ncbi:hypothetical protein F5H01DRAFT_319682 [Linnemannia elongata]|nr:hypothetical protein F5H01DRAFT_319682 [Linnemannia elongata]
MDKLAALGVMQYGITLPRLIPILKSLGLYDPVKSGQLSQHEVFFLKAHPPHSANHNHQVFDTVCLSCFHFLTNSSVLKGMNQGGNTMLGVKYLMIVTKYNRIQAVSFEARNPSYTTMSFETGVS